MDIPRRIRIDLMTPEELACRAAIIAIENIPYGDPLLTQAQTLIAKAQNKLADFIDRNDKSQAPFIGIPQELIPATKPPTWLISAPNGSYLAADLRSGQFFWTRDPKEAIHLSTEAIADGLEASLRVLAPGLFEFKAETEALASA